MDRATAKEEVRRRQPDFLEKAKQKVQGRTTYVCPACGNGSGSTGDGITQDPHTTDHNRYKCFKCGLSADVVELWKLHSNIQDDKEAFKSLYDYYGIIIDETQNQPRTEQKKPEPKKTEANKMGYFKECVARVGNTDYWKLRGLGEAVIREYMLGYDPNYYVSGGSWKVAIIPTGYSSFVARNTDPQADKKNRYRKSGASQLYQKKKLKEADSPIFVTEGEIDSLSIIECGFEALALGSTANYRQLLEELKKTKPAHPLIIALDNDEDGQTTGEAIEKGLKELGLLSYRCNPYGDSKDANEALLKDREAFKEELKRATEQALSVETELQEAEKEAYLKTSTAYYIQDFINGIAESVNTAFIPTGFKELDKVLEGGLYEGLYILGAISSLGKTTLALQIADQIAQTGQDVVIFSLEMARNELISKSVSRHTLVDIMENDGELKHAKTARGITTGSRYKYYSREEQAVIENAIETYGKYANHIYIHEGVGDIGTQEIRDTIKTHIAITGAKPVVFIDYIQILSPADVRATDKQNTDKAVLELKRISRDFKLPVLGISSVNRASYNTPATMEMLKESGSLEYGSDCVLGLQLKGVGSSSFDVNEAKNKNPREIELIILKNRNGATGGKLNFDYYPMFNYFEEGV